MKVAAVILALALIGACAAETAEPCTSNSFVCFFKDLGAQITHHAKKLGGQLAEVGTAVLKQAVDHGKSLLTSGAQAVAGTVLDHLNNEGLVGKRDLAFFDKVKSHIQNGAELLKQAKDGLHKAFKAAVTKLTGKLADMASLKKIDENADKEIDDAVEEFNKEGHKGFFSMAKAVAGKIKDIFAEGMSKLRERFGKKVEERAIFGFDSITDAWNKAKEHLSGLAGNVADAFKPHLDALKSGVANLAAKAKEHGGKLVAAATDSFNDLKTKLSGHLDTLKGHVGTLGTHAVNTVGALKDAISSIAAQAVSNAAGTLGDLVSTGTDAAGVVAGHVSDAVSGAVSN